MDDNAYNCHLKRYFDFSFLHFIAFAIYIEIPVIHKENFIILFSTKLILTNIESTIFEMAKSKILKSHVIFKVIMLMYFEYI